MMKNQKDTDYFVRLAQQLKDVAEEKLDSLELSLQKVIQQGNSIYVAGNGGSAAISTHFVTDLIKIAIDTKKRICAFDLTSNTALLTCIGNDYGYGSVFESQLQSIAKKGDLFIAISSSGNSENILRALETSDRLGVESWMIVGFRNALALNSCSNAINLNVAVGEYGVAEDISSAVCHNIVRRLRHNLE